MRRKFREAESKTQFCRRSSLQGWRVGAAPHQFMLVTSAKRELSIKAAYVQFIVLKNHMEVLTIMYKLFVLIFCIGIVMILASIALICCMNQEKKGCNVQLAGAFVTGVGLSGIVFTLFGAGPAILIGLICIFYIISNILSS